MILPIYTYGQPVLRKEAQDITPDYPELKKFIEDMWETLDLDVLSEDLPQYKDFRKVYINAHIEEYDDTEKDSSEEGCLSLPAIHEKVVRPTRIRVKYMDEDFQEHDEWVDGYLARVMQHEFDHLDGKMFIDRISPLRKQLIKSKLRALLQGRFRCGYKVRIPRGK